MSLSFRGPNPREWRIAVIDGPNMPNLGKRDKNLYGPISSLADLQKLVRDYAESLGVSTEQFASNHEGDILEFIHRTAADVDGYIINPAGLTTYGEATRHALDDTKKPVMEVHFSNTARHFSGVVPPYLEQKSRFTYSATGLVMGLRQYSYLGAMLGLTLSLDDEAFLDGGANRH
ncbi:type II 3-dehydroquinate dehydratase [Rhodococcus sp. T7]|uniref:type II 3-dehydroquinate dehydratase n=1 Tax=Rhodococcus sp. T7 TaxID=627444 RepID=UPI00135CCA90|nr:type II 3-dehydroquinate dehydratase [Rhodococcus sp. T7]KAF0957190.1 3-dehydroquinate dehydratase [Rhodococcus sp. T7]KAF0959028.1 3-dehydroquinate dehydratase [Rhodococcus sp. T7]